MAPYSMDLRKRVARAWVALSFAISPQRREGTETRTEKCIFLCGFAQAASVPAVAPWWNFVFVSASDRLDRTMYNQKTS